MIITYLLFALGIFLLIKSANLIIESSSSLAKKLKVKPIIIGLTVVAFGTSLPELVVNVFAAINGSSEIIFGNIIGSNISNILLILGITAIISNIKVRSETVWKEIPFAILSAFVLFGITSKVFFGANKMLVWSDGVILLSLFAMFIYYIYQASKSDKKIIKLVKEPEISWIKIMPKLLVGLVLIYFGGRLTVSGAIEIAQYFGLSEFLISATIISIGTTLPELIVSIVAATRKNLDLAIGNAIGSSIFNTLWVLGIIPFISSILIPQFIILDVLIMLSAMILLFVFVSNSKKQELTRTEGIIFIALYILYLAFIIFRG